MQTDRYTIQLPASPTAPYILFDTLLGRASSTHHTHESALTRKYTLQMAALGLALTIGGAR